MGLTIKYKAVFSTTATLEEKRRKMENLALDAAVEWAALLGLPIPELWGDNQGAILDLKTGAESFDLWKPAVWDWEGFTKTQYAENPLAHVQVCMILKALIDSDLFVADSITIDDEGEFFGNWYTTDNLVNSLAGNRKVLDGMLTGLKTVGWPTPDLEGHPNERVTSREEQIFKAALDYGLSEKDKLIHDIAKYHAMQLDAFLTFEFDKIRYPYVVHRIRDLQTDIAVFLYRFNLEELVIFYDSLLSMLVEDEITAFAKARANFYLTKIAKYWTPQHAERHAQYNQ